MGVNRKKLASNILLAMGLPAAALASSQAFAVCENFPEGPVFTGHYEQIDIVAGEYTLRELFNKGQELFVEKANKCDGFGRPATTGGGDKRVADEPAKLRTSAPDADSCSGCHAQPSHGGAGDFVANVFVLAQTLDPTVESVSSEFSNERNTLGMHGSGPIEMLSREMTVELQAQAAALPDGEHTLTTKGVDFEIVKEGGEVVSARGINTDLVVRPFHQVGVVVSLREFTVNAFNHHHGLQAEERFDLNPDKGFDPDYDEDGLEREMTIGDITATSLYQALLGTPKQVIPRNPFEAAIINKGSATFEDIGCADCHIPSMELDSPLFVEPNPFNPAGTWYDESLTYSFDMTEQGELPRLEKSASGGAIVRAYTDLKRHNLCDPEDSVDPIRFFCNEELAQTRPDQDGRPGTEFFLTRKLWDVGNTAPYGHRGDLTTITEAILMHGGEARLSRDNFVDLTLRDQEAVIKFLKSLQIVPPKNFLE